MVVSAILHDVDLSRLDNALKEMTGGMADFFDHEFAVIDIAALVSKQPQIDWRGLINLLKKYQLNAVAVRNARQEMHPDIIANGLTIDTMSVSKIEPNALSSAIQPDPAPTESAIANTLISPISPIAAALTSTPGVTTTQVTPALWPQGTSQGTPPSNAMIVDTPVRAGQRIYARGTDLIITAMVNNGAEIIADGSIHVYAPLRGRALAGASGDTRARIFATSMEPELVSIAGVYRTFENGFPLKLKGQAAQIQLTDDRIDVTSLNSTSRS